MRIFTASLGTESNTFAPTATCMDDFREMVFLRPGEHPADAPRMFTATLWAARRRAARENFTLIEGSCFAASPGGRTNRQDYEFMRDEILVQLRAAMKLDGVLFGLHGSMVAFAIMTSRATCWSVRVRLWARIATSPWNSIRIAT